MRYSFSFYRDIHVVVNVKLFVILQISNDTVPTLILTGKSGVATTNLSISFVK